MRKIEKIISKYFFCVIVILGIPAIYALFVHGFYGASDEVHIAWLFEIDRAFRMGQFPPRFVPDLSYGFGYPLFNFVFPLPFYLGEIIHLLGFSFVDSVKIVFALSVPLSGIFMYKFLRKYSSEIISLAGALVYIYTPYRATDIYVRGAFGEAVAFIFPPLLAWAIAEGNFAIIAISLAGLVLSHNIMAYMFVPLTLILIFFVKKKTIKSLWGVILGLLLSIYFWLPAITESSLMKYDTVFNFVDHFPTIRQLFTPYFGYGASVPGPYDGMSFYLGTINIALIALAIFFYKRLNKISLWALLVTGLSIFMMNFRSTVLWESIPFIKYFQFPWRFLSLTTFTTSVLVIVLEKTKYAKQIALAIVVGVILLNFNFFKPHDFLGREDGYFLNKYIPTVPLSEEYKQNQEEYLRLPKATSLRPSFLSPDEALSKSFETNNENDVVFNYYKYYFPGWVAKIDGKKVEIKAGEPYGQIQFIIPSGSHKVDLKFRETKFRLFLDIISLLSLALVITMVVGKGKIKLFKNR